MQTLNKLMILQKNTEFDENIIFEEVKDFGFQFGNNDGRMFFVPCYSEQNGYYTNELEIYYNQKQVLMIECPIIY